MPERARAPLTETDRHVGKAVSHTHSFVLIFHTLALRCRLERHP